MTGLKKVPATSDPGSQPVTVVQMPEEPSTSSHALLALLRIEGEARQAKSLLELKTLIANETTKICRAYQAFVFEPSGVQGMRMTTATGLPEVDRKVPLIEMLEEVVSRLGTDTGLTTVRDFKIGAYATSQTAGASAFPLNEALWVPLIGKSNELLAAILLSRTEPWGKNDHVLVSRLAEAFAHEWHWIASGPAPSRFHWATRKKAIGLAACLAVIGAIPVSLTTLAPLEIAARDQVVITAPLDGAIAEIPIAANSTVRTSDVMIRFEDTALRNRLAVAEREVNVAEAHVKKTLLQAVNDINGRHELAIARMEQAVKAAERDYARDLLARSTVLAPRDGVAVFGDKRELMGRPVGVGEKIMAIADPAHVEINADVSVSDAIILKPGARVKAYLDSDPLHAAEAVIVRADYQAKMRDSGILAFRVIARFDPPLAELPRLGARGTAQLFGDRVPVAYYLFRRPLAAARQWIGL
jgi:multidrug resistance efflux pump